MKRGDLIGMFVVVLGCAAGIAHTFTGNPELPPIREGAGGSLARGRALYESKCIHCHDGNGSANTSTAKMLNPRPRDFTKGVIKFGRGPNASLADLEKLIRDGVPQTSMAGFGAMPTEDIAAVAAYTGQLLGVSLKQSAPLSEEVRYSLNQALDNPDSANRGQKLFQSPMSACATCHGKDLQGKGPAAWHSEHGWLLRDSFGLPSKPRNFIADGLRGGEEIEDLYARIAFGIPGTSMPAMKNIFTDQEIAELVAYLSREILRSKN